MSRWPSSTSSATQLAAHRRRARAGARRGAARRARPSRRPSARSPSGPSDGRASDERAGPRSRSEQRGGRGSAAEAPARPRRARRPRRRVARGASRRSPIRARRRAAWPTGIPILLFPLRLETRFKRPPAGQPQLWVRVYPDDCLVDGFEESLTETGGRQRRRLLGRGLAGRRRRGAGARRLARAGRGRTGRAGRAGSSAAPAAEPDRQAARGDADDRAARHRRAGPAARRGRDLLGGGRGAAAATRRPLAAGVDGLEARVGAAAGHGDRRDTRPSTSRPAARRAHARPTRRSRCAVLQAHRTPTTCARTTSWSSAPRVDAAARTLRAPRATTTRRGDPPVELGSPVRGAADRRPRPERAPRQRAGSTPDHPTRCRSPTTCAWMFDFERALEVGMAFRFDLTAAAGRGRLRAAASCSACGSATPPSRGARRSSACSSTTSTAARAWSCCRRARRPTTPRAAARATRGATTRTRASDPSSSSSRSTSARADPLLRRDGQWLADAPRAARRPRPAHPGRGRDRPAPRPARCRSRCGRPPLGYLMERCWSRCSPTTTVAATRQFFTRYVSGRGPLPALRIGVQPYGIQPPTRSAGLPGSTSAIEAAACRATVHA